MVIGMNNKSFKVRFLTTFVTNIFRIVISFVAGLVIARSIGPGEYGDFSFLIGSFTSLATFVDMASSTAFYTFISKRQRGRKFFYYYGSWILLQLLILVLLVLFLPDSIRKKIWLGHPFGLVFLALIASFSMNQLWRVMSQIGESIRDTVGVQIRNLSLAVSYLICLGVLVGFHIVSIRNLFIINFIIYSLFSSVYAWRIYQSGIFLDNVDEDLKSFISEFKTYCLPLFLYTGVTFICSFADYWFLQKFGGSVQQGYFAIGARFSVLSLIATTSILQVFWKEIAEANSFGDMERVRFLFRLVSQTLYFLSALISCAIIPFSQEILNLLLGSSYTDAWLTLSLMFFCPLYQSMGQLTSTMLYAMEKTKTQSYIWGIVMVISIPITYLLLASDSAFVSGFQLGAIGMAIKRVGVLMLGVNISAFFVGKYIHLSFNWGYQIRVLLLLFPLGFLSKLVIQYIFSIEFVNVHIVLLMLFSVILYMVTITCVIYYFPSIAGLNRNQINYGFSWLRAKFKSV